MTQLTGTGPGSAGSGGFGVTHTAWGSRQQLFINYKYTRLKFYPPAELFGTACMACCLTIFPPAFIWTDRNCTQVA